MSLSNSLEVFLSVRNYVITCEARMDTEEALVSAVYAECCALPTPVSAHLAEQQQAGGQRVFTLNSGERPPVDWTQDIADSSHCFIVNSNLESRHAIQSLNKHVSSIKRRLLTCTFEHININSNLQAMT